MAVAKPRRSSVRQATVCSCQKRRTNITPTAKNPGISLMLCNHPNSIPEKLAVSTTKLLIKTDQVAYEIGIAIAISVRKIMGPLKEVVLNFPKISNLKLKILPYFAKILRPIKFRK